MEDCLDSFSSTALNYVNRQTFSLLAPVISQQLHFSHEDLSRVFGAFQITYAWTWLLGGVFLVGRGQFAALVHLLPCVARCRRRDELAGRQRK